MKGWNTTILLDKVDEMHYQLKARRLVKGKPFLILVQDADKKYTGVYEGIIEKNDFNQKIVVKPTTPNSNKLLDIYMKIHPYFVITQKHERCCEDYNSIHQPTIDSLFQD